MKKKLLFLLITYFAINLQINAQYFTENFENGGSFPSGWTLSPGTGDDWAIDEGDDYGPGSAQEGTYCAFFNDYDYSSGNTAEMITPNIDLSNANNPILRFWYYDDGGSNIDFVEVLVSTDGSNYTLIYSTPTEVSTWTEITVDLSAYSNESTVTISWKGTSVYGSSNPHVDNISVITCLEPSDLTASNETSSGADLQWTENGSSTNWDLEIGETGFSPSGTPTDDNVTSNSYTWNGGNSNTTYDYYVRADCGADNIDVSVWVGPYSFTTEPDYCGGDHFYDTGGESGSYSNNEDIITTICPDVSGDVVTVTFNTFSTESYWDELEIHDGDDISTTSLGSFSGSSIPGPFTSTHSSGCLTFHFTSSLFFVDEGWDATIECDVPLNCPAPSNQAISNLTHSTVDLGWDENGPAVVWDIEWGPTGFTQGNGTMITGVSDNPYLLSGLLGNTTYDWYIRSDCNGSTISGWVGPHTFRTPPVNDNCDGAYPYTDDFTMHSPGGCDGVYNTIDLTSVTNDEGHDDPSCDQFINYGVWYTWTATSTGLKFYSPLPSRPGLAVYEAGACGSLVEVGCLNNVDYYTIDGLIVGNDYILYIWDDEKTEGVMEFCLEEKIGNDACADAEALPVGFECTNTQGTNVSASASGETPYPSCSSFGSGEDVWYSVVVPPTGTVTVEMSDAGGPSDWAMAIYSGNCGNLTEVECDDNDGDGNFPKIELTGQTPGETLYVRVFEYGNDETGFFNICAYRPCSDPGWVVLPASGDATTSTGSCEDGDWTHYFNGADLLLSLKLGGTGAVITDVTIDPDGSTDGYYIANDADGFPQVENAGGAAFMRRKWDVNASTQPSSEVGVRFYYTGDEYDAINSELSAHSESALIGHNGINFYKVTSGEDPFDIGPGGIGGDDYILIKHGSTPGIEEWVDGTQGSDFYAEFNVEGFSGGGAGAGAGAALLPLEFGAFKGYVEINSNRLYWFTLSESNTSEFVVERSMFGKEWNEVVSLDAAGNSRDKMEYTAFDETPLNSAYYRLRTIDLDGKSSLSDVILITRVDNKLRVNSIYPNPNKGSFVLNVTTMKNENTSIRLVNTLGVTVYTKELSQKGGASIESINVNNLPNGVYTLIVAQNNYSITKRIVINR